MSVFQVAGLGVVAAVLLVVVRRYIPELAVGLSLAASALILLLVVDELRAILNVVSDLANRAGAGEFYVGTVLRVIGISYVAEFAAQIARDAGEGALASKVELAAKVLILVLAVPVLVAVMDLVLSLLG